MFIKAVPFLLLVTTTLSQTFDSELDSVLEYYSKLANAHVVNESQPSTIVPLPKEEESVPCTTKNNEPGKCVQSYQCDKDTKTINTNGNTIISLRFRSDVCSNFEVCCRLADKRPTDDPTTPPPKEKKEGCGWSNPKGVGGLTITSQTDGKAQFGEYPWMVAILTVKPVKDDKHFGQELIMYVGGGSLIHMKVVLTAAHHIASAKNLRARAGEWDTQTTKEIIPHQDRDVDTLEIHEDYIGTNKNANQAYDVALLFLKKPFDPAPNVGVACLPPPKQIQKEGTNCFASVWGKDMLGNNGRPGQVILKKVEIPVVNHEVCQELLRKTRLGKGFKLEPSLMCAGGAVGKDVCKGNGGSPLVCPIEVKKDRYVQAGIVAWGIGCGGDGAPGVYIDVAAFRDWIDGKMAAKGYGNEMVYAKY